MVRDDTRIPPDVVVSAGFGARTKSFTVPVYILSHQDMVQLEDEQPVPCNGFAHPIPHQAAGWFGPIGDGQQNQALNLEESHVGDVTMSNIQDPPAEASNHVQMLVVAAEDPVPSGNLSGAAADFQTSGEINEELEVEQLAKHAEEIQHPVEVGKVQDAVVSEPKSRKRALFVEPSPCIIGSSSSSV